MKVKKLLNYDFKVINSNLSQFKNLDQILVYNL